MFDRGGCDIRHCLRVTYFQRKTLPGLNYGIEQVFETVRDYLQTDIEAALAISPCMSRGLMRRAWNMLVAPLFQGEVNHVTGDIHYVTFLLFKRRTVLTIHDCGFEVHTPGVRSVLFSLLWLRIPALKTAIIATDSEFSKERIVAHTRCDPRKVLVVGCCISPTFRRCDKLFEAANPVVLHVGTSANKNLERVCQALLGVSCALRIIGPLSKEQHAALDASGVEWSNNSGLSDEELYAEYMNCDLVIFASTYEGFGLPIIEGNTVGRPVVTSSVASMPEVAGGAACFVDPYDVGSIRRGVLRIIEDGEYRTSLVELGYENAKRFTARKCALEYLAIYRTIANGAS